MWTKLWKEVERAGLHLEPHRDGAPVNVEAQRLFSDAKNPARSALVAWSTPVDSVDQPRARAIWHLPAGDFTYGEFELAPGSLAFDVNGPPPG